MKREFKPGVTVGGPLVEFPRCHLTTTHAAFDPVDFKQWREIGEYLCRVSGSSFWWLGDWINAGAKWFLPNKKEGKLNEQERQAVSKYKRAIELTGYDVQTLMDAAWVARSIPVSCRQEKLSFGHHVAVAGLDAKARDKFLKLAVEHEWTRSELRQAIRKANAEHKHETKPGSAIRFVLSRWASDMTRWFTVQLEDVPLEEWPEQRRAAVLRELQPVEDIIKALRAQATPRKESLLATTTNR